MAKSSRFPRRKATFATSPTPPPSPTAIPPGRPDGKSIAYFSDESGEYALHISPQNGLGPVTKIDLGKPPSFFYSPTWSPDSKKITYSDKRLNLWYVDLEKKTPVHVDTDLFDGPNFNTVWSPDSKWLAYTKQLDNHMHAVFVYSLETGKATQITDGMSDALFPDFDKSGKYLYFTASTDMGLVAGRRHVGHRPAGDALRLRGGSQEGSGLAAGARERRRKTGKETGRRRRQGRFR